jgi:diguanylate cyclase (GGDEF)-like protein
MLTPLPQRRDSAAALKFLATLAQGLTAALDTRQLIEWTLKALREDAGFHSSTIALTGEGEPEVLTITGASGLATPLHGLRVPSPLGLGWAALQANHPLYVADVQRDERRFHRCRDIRSSIYAPLTADHEPIGTLAAHAATIDAFGPEDLALAAVIARYVANLFAIARLQDRLRGLAETDPLTGLSNRRRFLAALDRELDRARRTSASVMVALLDLDGFKALNDTHGHLAGDTALQQVGRRLLDRLRASDVLARFGGDEFAVLLPETGPDAPAVLRRLARLTISLPPHGSRLSVAVSWGAASSPADGTDAQDLLRTADARLYTMKKERRQTASPARADSAVTPRAAHR